MPSQISRSAESERVTMATIARIAGVTQPTVSRAFSHPDKLSAETLARIMDAVRLTGYVPNLVAGALASNRTRILAAIVPSITNVIYSSLLQPFIMRVRESGYQTMVMESGLSEAEEERLVFSALARRPEGILLTGVGHSRECVRQLMLAGIPVVEVWDITENPIHMCVGFSHHDVARDAALHLLSKGYRDLAVISAEDVRALRRSEAFCNAVEAAGVAHPREILVGGAASIKRGREALSRLVDSGFRCGAIFCSSDVLAHGVLIEAQSRGIAIPADIGLLGFGDQEFAAQLLPPLSSIDLDRQRIGSAAAEAMIEALEMGTAANKKSIRVDYRIVERGTLAAE